MLDGSWLMLDASKFMLNVGWYLGKYEKSVFIAENGNDFFLDMMHRINIVSDERDHRAGLHIDRKVNIHFYSHETFGFLHGTLKSGCHSMKISTGRFMYRCSQKQRWWLGKIKILIIWDFVNNKNLKVFKIKD